MGIGRRAAAGVGIGAWGLRGLSLALQGLCSVAAFAAALPAAGEETELRGTWRVQAAAAYLQDSSPGRVPLDDTESGSIVLGVEAFEDKLRWEMLDLSTRRYDSDHPFLKYIRVSGLMTNVLYAPIPNRWASPMAGVGVGGVFYQANTDNQNLLRSKHNTTAYFAWNLKAALEIKLIDEISIVPEYRLLGSPGVHPKFLSHELGVGLQLNLR